MVATIKQPQNVDTGDLRFDDLVDQFSGCKEEEDEEDEEEKATKEEARKGSGETADVDDPEGEEGG